MSYIGKQPIRTALTSSDIEDGVITAAKIEDGAVVAAEIASNAVTTAKINADAVTAAKIADNAISEEHLDATVVTGLTALEAEPADTDEFLVSDAGTLKRIDYSHIKGGVEDGAITTAKIADDAVTTDKVNLTGDVGINTTSPASIGSNITTLEITGGSTVRTGGVKISNSDKSIRSSFYGSNSGLTFGTETNQKLSFVTNNTARAELDTSGNLKFNSGLGAVQTAYGVRAWVNFDGTGTLAIQASGGVSSVTDNSVGSYTINFSTDMPDANWIAVNGSGYVESTSAQQWFRLGMNIPDDVDHHDVTARKVDNDAASFVSADIQRAQIAYIR